MGSNPTLSASRSGRTIAVVDFTGASVGLAVTGLIPVVAIGSFIGILVAVRDERRDRAIGFGVLLAISLAAMAWLYFFVFQ